jgi:hypothetical protein
MAKGSAGPGDERPGGPESTVKMASEPPPGPKRGAAPEQAKRTATSSGVHMPESWDARHSAEIPPKVEVRAADVPAEEPEGASRMLIVLGILTVLAVSAAAGFVAWEMTNPGSKASTPTPSATPSQTPTATPSAAPSQAPSQVPSQAPSGAR